MHTVEKQEDNKKEEEACKIPVNNTTSDSHRKTENTKVENENAELVCEDLNEKEKVSVKNEADNQTEESLKGQWDLPRLTNTVYEAATSLQAPQIANEELTRKSQNLKSELSNKEELKTVNEPFDNAAVDIDPSNTKIDPGGENESKEKTAVAPSEPKKEKKTEAVNSELDSTTQFEGKSNLSLPELEEVKIKTDNLETDNTEHSHSQSLADETTSSDKVYPDHFRISCPQPRNKALHLFGKEIAIASQYNNNNIDKHDSLLNQKSTRESEQPCSKYKADRIQHQNQLYN